MPKKSKVIIILAIIACSTLHIYGFCAKECRKAYTFGYYAGFSAKICNLAFDYYPDKKDKFVYVGEGNENYNIYPYHENMGDDLNRRRGKRFWWATYNTKKDTNHANTKTSSPPSR